VLSTCTDPAREAAFHRWYEDIHVADILETGVFHTAYRDESLDPQATQATSLALSETEQSDPAKAREALGPARAAWEKRGRLSDTIKVVAFLTARRLWPLDEGQGQSRPAPPVAPRQRRGHAGLQHGVGDPRRFWVRPQHRSIGGKGRVTTPMSFCSTGGKGRVTTPMSFCIAIHGRRGDRSLYFGRVMVYHGPQGAL